MGNIEREDAITRLYQIAMAKAKAVDGEVPRKGSGPGPLGLGLLFRLDFGLVLHTRGNIWRPGMQSRGRGWSARALGGAMKRRKRTTKRRTHEDLWIRAMERVGGMPARPKTPGEDAGWLSIKACC